VGDLAGVAMALAPRPLRMESLVDGQDRVASTETLDRIMEPVRAAYRSLGAERALRAEQGAAADPAAARWILQP
jgi:hypothetical protein